ncbi:isopentenyl-diphosphate Delta-isomerase [Nocardia panacis]|uniref:Isopentenyl-diphosphate Delta-isomerase n=1 Tax=Nocardia panacis TaxID=2340916 RepID=A0A3A4K838_9NOCA|nr:isopentenyl-diphosphate Delta-isomerase [Nocardia panacis]
MPVELVDAQGRAVGACPVAQAHTAPGLAHRAFSVLLFDGAERVLLQRRAAVKTRFPNLWTNTCCGHPAPGQPVVEAAAVRLYEEFGLSAALTEIGVFSYRAGDPATGRVEHEWDHVLIGTLFDAAPQPDPDEISDYAWIGIDTLRVGLASDPAAYTPWLSGVLDVVEDVLSKTP